MDRYTWLEELYTTSSIGMISQIKAGDHHGKEKSQFTLKDRFTKAESTLLFTVMLTVGSLVRNLVFLDFLSKPIPFWSSINSLLVFARITILFSTSTFIIIIWSQKFVFTADNTASGSGLESFFGPSSEVQRWEKFGLQLTGVPHFQFVWLTKTAKKITFKTLPVRAW